ncbi:Helix-turn-helix domain protein [Streptomyces sp. ADI97-07]|uniref:helix-turn-helix domain-containing protein n=1 Tax=Streptomyces sp. ADI97-07 TaxID=1522762 RepID=UPI000F54CB25|nr:helix-turn-helix transcriptional regulator [Streptomyces sp. ADI97-07]RPK76403.1 Helix-turn-helix domain protein [Streptomyces sp. ADI97-07]
MSYARLHLTSSGTLRDLMRWGPNGSSVSIRELAAAVGVSKSKIEALLSEQRPTATREVAERICKTLDVRLSALFFEPLPTPTGMGTTGRRTP